MNIVRHKFHTEPLLTLEQFADKHGLTMVIWDYSPRERPYCARFEHAEVRERVAMLSCEAGCGATESEAIADYADRIKGKLLIVHATDPDKRKEIRVPQEWAF